MDPIISKYNYMKDGILNYCHADGVAYQRDMSKSVPYDRPYFEKYIMYEKSAIGRALNRSRVDAVRSWASKIQIIDIGVGCGTFIKYALGADLNICGFDINPCAIHWLHKRVLFEDPYAPKRNLLCYTFWDSLEHIPEPQKLLEKIGLGSYVFVSLPIYTSLEEITNSKHFRPDEHYYYFTTSGFLKWMRAYNFELRKIYNFEIEAGRDGIKTFLFERVATKSKKRDGKALQNYFEKEQKNNAVIGGALCTKMKLNG